MAITPMVAADMQSTCRGLIQGCNAKGITDHTIMLSPGSVLSHVPATNSRVDSRCCRLLLRMRSRTQYRRAVAVQIPMRGCQGAFLPNPARTIARRASDSVDPAYPGPVDLSNCRTRYTGVLVVRARRLAGAEVHLLAWAFRTRSSTARRTRTPSTLFPQETGS